MTDQLLTKLLNLDIFSSGHIVAEYIWISGGRLDLRSKGRIVEAPKSVADLRKWNYDGSSAIQVDDDEIILHPQATFRDQVRRDNNILVPWYGTECHTNYSKKNMREDEVIKAAIEKLIKKRNYDGSNTNQEIQAHKKVVLFGRIGDGKSSVANALVTGGVERMVFEIGDSARGCTSEIQKETGRGWTVIDTVGLGEAQAGTITKAQVKEMLTQFLKKVKDEYSHILFVQKANRVTIMDKINWLLFNSIFQGAEDAFVILFTGADETWLEENKRKLPKYMEGFNILAVDIPPISNRKVTEKRWKEIRDKSIRKLEADLVEIFQSRGKAYFAPNIAKMSDAQLEERSWYLMEYVVEDLIKPMIDSQLWLTVASKLSSVIDVVSLIEGVIRATSPFGGL